MVDAFLSSLPADWDRHVEVPVYRPVRGIVDVVIVRRATGRIVSIEAHSELRRLEQQLGWAAAKADALPSAALWPAIAAGDPPVATSRILLLRSTANTRALARSFASTFAAAYRPTQRHPRSAPGSGPTLAGQRHHLGPVEGHGCRSSKESRAGLGREANLTTSQQFLSRGWIHRHMEPDP
jgi:hypothetical protein